MGKLLDVDRTEVKREVVSASANLEVISHEHFVKRLEGMSSACANCHRERSHHKQGGRTNKTARRKQQSKSNTPLVIHLKDTLSKGRKHRALHMDADSDVSARSTDEEQFYSSRCNFYHHPSEPYRGKVAGEYQLSAMYSDVASIPEFVPQYSSHLFHQAWPQTVHTAVAQPAGSALHTKSPYHSFHTTTQKAKEKSRKNFTALISVIEKAHKKDVLDIEQNLSKNSVDAKLCNVLNNVTLSSQNDVELKRKNMAECENVELICNDLSTNADKLQDSTDESDTSDKASVVSSTDTLSDDVAENLLLEHEFTPSELEQLAEYTTGAPLVRYGCPVSQCPDCISNSWYNYQYLQYESSSPSYVPRNNHYNPFQYSSYQQQQRGGHKLHPKVAAHPRISSSDSDVSSDVDDGSTTSSRSSVSSSSSSGVKATASAKTRVVPSSSHQSGQQTKRARNPKMNTFNPKTRPKKEIHQPVKRATASWKGARQLWDIDVSQGARRSQGVSDSVYMDLTGLDVTYTVIYHADVTPLWPYPVHSLYQAMYTPSIPVSLHPKYSHLPAFSPHKVEMIPSFELKKYEMSMPPNRPWIPTGSPDKDVPAAVFSVMCYNVLCDKLCTKAMYAYCPTWALSWDYRKKGIMNDIIRGNADILTLQEVETEQYHNMFFPELADHGYDGIFLPKSRVKTMNSDKEKKSVDGCAIFYKKNKFEKVNEYQIEFSQLATKEGASNTDTDMINRVSTKDNIAIVAVLRTKPDVYQNSPVPAPKGLTQMLMVSTAHIHWDPQSPDVKLVQTMMLVEELQKFVKEASMQFRPNAPPPSLDVDLCNSMPLILCGDFNSLPDSGVYEFLSKGRLDISHKDFEGQNYQVFMKDRCANGIINHNFNLTSAYKDVIPFTNYTFDFKGVIDYIFYSDQHLRLHGVMGLQDEEWFRANKIIGCPHPFVPSDHFPLFAEFSLPVHPQRPR
ncbi:CCR4-NOT transcription complex subunit 6 isoform X2 [Biomphalaria glabrata]|uniref:poly(A)-specific ribonuclease n=1 Tax=Biomphalaria glabrata TaxID=6526 RepID=A0A2C9KC56_BIOGL|nr:CCR4-NOT transcription complex subunit 6 isoform X2 [Biomphalaria glabrata]